MCFLNPLKFLETQTKSPQFGSKLPIWQRGNMHYSKETIRSS